MIVTNFFFLFFLFSYIPFRHFIQFIINGYKVYSRVVHEVRKYSCLFRYGKLLFASCRIYEHKFCVPAMLFNGILRDLFPIDSEHIEKLKIAQKSNLFSFCSCAALIYSIHMMDTIWFWMVKNLNIPFYNIDTIIICDLLCF